MPQASTLPANHPPDFVVYTLEGTINDFFASHIPIRRKQCDGFAASLYGDPVNPMPIQGCFSYIVIAGHKQSKIVQFRAADSDFDTNILELAHRVHGQHLVPACTFHGRLGTSAPLSIYSMEKVPGDTFISVLSEYMKASGTPPGPGLNPYNTTLDFALFFAAAWKARQVISPYTAQGIHADYQERFKLLAQVLPSRYQQNLEMVRRGLSLLFMPTFPMVLNHGDLYGMNFLVNPSNGHLTGVIDWAEAQICPFGMSLWGARKYPRYYGLDGMALPS
ncbi:Protein kinase-like protein [Penicillium frequentans]|nr:Protein kinase-like protein [Penicillium glabrum]